MIAPLLFMGLKLNAPAIIARTVIFSQVFMGIDRRWMCQGWGGDRLPLRRQIIRFYSRRFASLKTGTFGSIPT